MTIAIYTDDGILGTGATLAEATADAQSYLNAEDARLEPQRQTCGTVSDEVYYAELSPALAAEVASSGTVQFDLNADGQLCSVSE